MAKKAAVKKAEPVEQKIVDDFVVDDDGLVEMCLSLRFEEDLTVRVTPAVAKRMMEGEYDGQDPGDCERDLNVSPDDVVNLRMSIEDIYEACPPRGSMTSIKDE